MLHLEIRHECIGISDIWFIFQHEVTALNELNVHEKIGDVDEKM